MIYRASGRTEIIGNHCDHQNGRVIAAAIDRYIEAEVEPRDDDQVTLVQEEHGRISLSLSDTLIRAEEKETSASLVRGVAAYFTEKGYRLRGFDAKVTSHVPVGSGVSSSAAYEILIGRILTGLSDRGTADPVSLAIAGLYAENHYFGKPSGLMDQMAIANGGMTYIDFADPQKPENIRMDFDVEDYGYKLCLVGTGSSHSDLTDDYASIPHDMRKVAEYFGKRVLREVDRAEFEASIPQIRKKCGDRAVLRAAHFFGENLRVLRLREAVERRDITNYIELVRQSGRSSYELLQNIYPPGAASDQSIALALMLAERALEGEGACRVHGGGFAGTIQAYVPEDRIESFRDVMEDAFGSASCHFVTVSS